MKSTSSRTSGLSDCIFFLKKGLFYLMLFIIKLDPIYSISLLILFFYHLFTNFIGFKIILTIIIYLPNQINPLFGKSFPPIKVYCYNISKRWMPDNKFIKKLIYYPDSKEFQFFNEIEVHRELLLSPILTYNPNEASLFYVPIYPFACKSNEQLLNITALIKELRQLGPWYDRKHGTDHIITSGFDPIYAGSPISREFYYGTMIICTPFPVVGRSWSNWYHQRNVIIPFVSFFPNYPFENVDWEKKRKNTVFIAHTYHTSNKSSIIRRKITKAVEKVKKHDIIIFTRHSKKIIETVKQLPKHYIDSDFCICPRGDVPTAKRSFDASYFGCIPVFISDDIVYPFSGNLLNYSTFSLQIKEKDVDKIPEILENFSQSQIKQMRKRLREAAKVFRFRPGEKPRIGEAFWAISWMWYIRHIYHLQFDFKYYT